MSGIVTGIPALRAELLVEAAELVVAAAFEFEFAGADAWFAGRFAFGSQPVKKNAVMINKSEHFLIENINFPP